MTLLLTLDIEVFFRIGRADIYAIEDFREGKFDLLFVWRLMITSLFTYDCLIGFTSCLPNLLTNQLPLNNFYFFVNSAPGFWAYEGSVLKRRLISDLLTGFCLWRIGEPLLFLLSSSIIDASRIFSCCTLKRSPTLIDGKPNSAAHSDSSCI